MTVLTEDIIVEQQAERLRFGNSRIALEFGPAGEWLSLTAPGLPGSLIASGTPTVGVDVLVDGQWLVERDGAALVSHFTTVGGPGKGATCSLVYSLTGHYELTVGYTLFPGKGQLDRRITLQRKAPDGAPDVHLEAFRFRLPGACVGDPAACVVDVPGPWFPNTYVAPGTPYPELLSRNVGFHGAPDGSFGFLAITNQTAGRVLAAWMDTSGETGYVPSLHGDGTRLSFTFDEHRAMRLPAAGAATSAAQRTTPVAGSLPDALHEYRAMATRTMPLDPKTPAWVRDMVLLEIYPRYFPGGLKEITARLLFYKNIGFNTVYLMPHWTGGYSPIDLYQVDPALGTAAELKEMVRAAHALGLRVLFDMVIHGFNESSPVVQEHPELFIHDEQGNVARHPTWKSMSTDWAAPAYQRYMVELVQHDLRTYGNDGYRVDAASYKGPNWSAGLPYPAYRSASDSPDLMRRMMAAMRAIHPDAVMLSEVYGPIFYTACNLVHDNQTEAPQQLLEQMEAGHATPADYKAHMADVQDLLPAGANRVYFARNHDTSWFYHFNGYTPPFLALDAIHILCAIPEVFAGDPDHKPNPDDDPATWAFYRKLFALRRQFPELEHGETLFRAAESSNPWVFTALRRSGGHTSLIAVSLSAHEEATRITLPGRQTHPIRLTDPVSSAEVKTRKDGDVLVVKLKPCQVLVGRLP